jgi:hypothetical protein
VPSALRCHARSVAGPGQHELCERRIALHVPAEVRSADVPVLGELLLGLGVARAADISLVASRGSRAQNDGFAAKIADTALSTVLSGGFCLKSRTARFITSWRLVIAVTE